MVGGGLWHSLDECVCVSMSGQRGVCNCVGEAVQKGLPPPDAL